MPYAKLQFRPGIIKDLTSYTNTGGWYDCNLVRFRLGFPETMGGWVKAFENRTFEGACRSINRWSTLAGNQLMGFGTTFKFYIELGEGFYDITPIRRTATGLSGPFSISNGENTLAVTDAGHGVSAGTFITISGATGLGGNVTAAVLNAEHQVAEVIDGNNYTILLDVTANASDTGNGGTVNIAYQVNAGLNTQVGGTGWSAGAWNTGAWGEGSSFNVDQELRIWTMDNFGEDLVFNVRNGNIYYWDASSGATTRGVTLNTLSSDSTCPTIASQVLVSDRDRHVIAFGANDGGLTPADPLRIRFSNQEDPLTWTSTATNTAGDLILGTGSKIQRAIETKREVLVWTDKALHSMQYIGPPYTYGIQQISSTVTLNGFNSIAAVEDTVFWMGRNVFYRYDGQVSQMVCPIEDYLFNDFNEEQKDKVFAGVNTAFSEVIWFYPSADSEENNRYVIYNWKDNAWYYGSMARTAWIDCCPAPHPIAAGIDNQFYQHETGITNGENDPATPLDCYIESSPIEIGDGYNAMLVRSIIPDLRFRQSTGSPQVQMTLTMQNYPGSEFNETLPSNITRTEEFPVEHYTQKVNVRLRGRSVRFKIASNRDDTHWLLGSPRLDMVQDGQR